MKRKIAVFLLVFLLLALLPTSAGADETNLALGKAATVETYIENSKSYTEHQKVDNLALLTDGDYRPADFGDSGWVKFYRATGRVLTIDLGEICTVERVFTRFMQNSFAGVVAPKMISVFASCDGKNFYPAENAQGGECEFIPSYGATNYIASYNISVSPLRARYIALSFDVTVNSFVDEVEIYGSVGSVLPERKDFTDIIPAPKGEYLDRNALDGDTDIVCFHAGYSPEDEKLVNNDKDAFMPYVAYIDEKGRVTDTMFDSVMFLTLQGKCPSGANLTITGAPTVMSDWIALLDSYFHEEYNLNALDAATADMKKQLSLDPEYRVSVYLTVPYPKISDKEFGDYNGDGISDKILEYADCLAVTDWFMGEVEKRFAERNYENIALKGYFCNSEGLTRQNHDYEYDFARDAAELMEKRGLKCVMIPYYQAVGIDANDELGFEAMLMQPNLSFNPDLQDDPAGMMEDFAATAKQYGLGIQMEIADGVRWEPDRLGAFYMQYLVSASRSGLMTDTIHAYYNGAGPGVFYDCAHSDQANMRIYYDLTYKFIKGTLDFPQEKVRDDYDSELTCNMGEEVFSETGVLGDWYCSYRVKDQTNHGYTVMKDGETSFKYRPDRNFSGEDFFEYEILYGGEVIATRSIKITVNGGSVSETEAIESVDCGADTEQGGLTGVILAIIAIIAVFALILAVFLSKARKKK